MPINRYTSLTPSAYKPLTQEEIMTVPLAMRAQHNQTQQQVQSGLEELDKLNSLDYHTPELIERKNMLIGKIDALSSDLANKGFSNDMTNTVFKLNREIKNELGPQGRLGQINNAYQTYNKNFTDFKKSNEDKKWSDKQLKLNWSKHSSNYQGYDDKGNITNIGSLNAPEKVLISDRMKTLTDIMGDSKMASEFLNGGMHIEAGPNGSVQTINTETGEKHSYNNPQVISVLKTIYSELNDPNSDLSISREYSGQDIYSAIQEAHNMGQSAIDVSNGKTDKSSGTLHGYKNPDDMLDNGMNLVDVVENSEDYSGSVGEAYQTVNYFSSKNFTSLTDDQKEKYIEAKGMINQFEKNKYDHSKATQAIGSDGKNAAVKAFNSLGYEGTNKGLGITYKKVEEMKNVAETNFLSKYKKGSKEYEIAKNLVKGNSLTAVPVETKIGHQAIFDKVVKSWTKDVQRIATVANNYKNDIFKHQNNYTARYTPLVANADSKTGKKMKEIDAKIEDTMRSSDALNSLGSITQVTNIDGKSLNIKDMKNVTDSRTAVSKVMQTAKSIKPISFSPDDRGFPSIKFRVEPGENNEHNELVNGWWAGERVGNNTSFDVTLRLGDMSNISGGQNKYGTNSVVMEYIKTMALNGDVKTKAMALDMIKSIKQLETK